MPDLINSVLEDLSIPEKEAHSLIHKFQKFNVGENVLIEHALRKKKKSEFLLSLLAEWVSIAEELNMLFERSFQFLEGKFNELSHFEKGIYWHLIGYLKAKKKTEDYLVIRSLNRSLEQMEKCTHPNKDYYLSRIYNTLGQITYAKDKLEEAIWDYSNALKFKEASGDMYGQALTYGNLGRLYYEMGKYELSIQYLKKDLKVLELHFPKLTIIRGIVHSNIGNCLIALKDFGEAKKYYDKSLDLAIRNDHSHSQIFPLIGLSRVAVYKAHFKEAKELIPKAENLIRDLKNTIEKNTLSFFLYEIKGKLYKCLGDFETADILFENAKNFIPNSRISQIQASNFLTEFAHFKKEIGKEEEAISLLRSALQGLDSTSAGDLRTKLEKTLKLESRDQWLLHTFSRFTGIKNLEALLDQTGLEGFSGKSMNVAVLFIDIRGFTTIAEKISAEEVIVLLNEFLERMIRLIQSYGGYIDKILGDSVLAYFSMPSQFPDDCDRATLCALHMLEEVNRMNLYLNTLYSDLRIGIGLHYGELVAGLIGSASKRSFTAIGDVVNTCSRLEGMTKILGPKIIVSKDFIKSMSESEAYYFLPLGKYIPLGRNKSIELFSVEGMKRDCPDLADTRDLIKLSNEGLYAFFSRDFTLAISRFQSLFEMTGYEAFNFLKLSSKKVLETGPGDDWDGSIELMRK